MLDPYKVLGVTSEASFAEVKAAYRRVAQKYHPDAGGDAWAFQQVQQAFETLQRQHAETESGVLHTQPPVEAATEPATAPPQATKETRQRAVANFLTAQLPLQNETTYFILINVLDIIMTYLLLRFGGIETNPLAVWVLQRWGFRGLITFKMVVVALVCLVTQIIALRSLKHARFVLISGIFIVGTVVVYSVYLLAVHGN